jgi:RNA-directed DNA polymerase
LDDAVSKYCKEIKICYTRYADDLTFSGKFNDKELFEFLLIETQKLKLQINNEKTKVMTPNTRQTVTGIVVNEKAQVSFKKRNELRQIIYYIKKFGLENHMDRLNIKKQNYVDHLLGQVNFIIYINPTDNEFIEYKKYLQTLKNPLLSM